MGSKAYGGLSAGIFMIGLGVLFLSGVGVWPWILVVIGLASLPASMAAKQGWYGWQGSVWLIGLAILFATGQLFPGVLILVGISAIGSALTRDAEGSPFADQRTATPPVVASSDTRPLNLAPDLDTATQPVEPAAPTSQLDDPDAADSGHPSA
ncbi:MAG: hypothetical protein GX557_10190 [Chloroflexi bacterium]|nr:hypothetical protein [Chloroflexota bacterium]